MTNQGIQRRSAGGASVREIVAAGALLGLMLLGELALARPDVVYNKGVWYDECLTYLIAGDPDSGHAMRALRAGLDGMPPPYYYILRAAHGIVGGGEMPVYRGCSTLAMWIALLAVYATLRTALNPLAAAVAVLLFWMNPLMARYAVEARPYAMMLAGIACVAWGLRLRGWRAVTVVLAAAAFTCTIHYLGIVALSVMLLGELAGGADSIKARLRRIAPGVVGMGALLPLLPMLSAQCAGIGPSWVDPLSAWGTMQVLIQAFFCLPLIVLLAAWWWCRMNGPAGGGIDPAALRRLSPLFAMLTLPLALLICSRAGDSLILDRYLIAGLLGMPALAAPLLAETGGWPKMLLLAALLAGSAAIVYSNFSRLEESQAHVERIAQDAAGDHYNLIFESSSEALPVWLGYPELRPRIAIIDLPPQSLGSLPRVLAHTQYIERKTEDLYDLPPRLNSTEIAKRGLFRLIGESENLPAMLKWTPLVLIDVRQGLCEMRP